jgi:hypothetical protein
MKSLFLAAVFACLAAAQASPPGTPVSMVVTVEARRGKSVPDIDEQDVIVRQQKERRPVTAFRSLADAPTQLLLLIDDSARSTFGSEIAGLKQFINSLPSNFAVAIGYMRNGMTQFTQQFTNDHAAAANAIRVASGPGGADVSPYDSLTDAIKKWPLGDVDRKEVLMISSGIEGLGGGYYYDNPYVTAGIQSALKAGTVVYTIYNPSVGHAGHSLWRTTWGQNFLSRLADETGGESYYVGFGSPVSFQPFLDKFKEAQQHQYQLTFLARPAQKAGFQPVQVLIEGKDASIAAPDQVWVKAGL